MSSSRIAHPSRPVLSLGALLALALGTGCLATQEDLAAGDEASLAEELDGTASALAACQSQPLQVSGALASSLETSSFAAALAADGNPSTRWSSTYADPQWLRLDLGGQRHVSSVSLDWETASAADYRVELSADGSTWSTVASVLNAAHGARQDTLVELTSRTGRYLRVVGTRRTTQWGYSLFEVRVNGDTNAACASSARDLGNNLEAEDHDGMSGVQYEATADVGGGQNAGWIEAGDYLEWRVNVPRSGSYELTARSATWTHASLAVVIDGVQASELSVPSTWQGQGAQYQTWSSFTTAPFTLSAGVHTLRVIFTGGGQNLNWVKLSESRGELETGLWRVVSRRDLSTLGFDGVRLSGGSYGARETQEWRLTRTPAGYTLALSSDGRCLTAAGQGVSLGSCTAASASFTVEQLRARSEQRPALYRLRAADGACLRFDRSVASLATCTADDPLYVEPVGWGERAAAPVEFDLKALLLVKQFTDVAEPRTQATIPADIVAAAQVSYIDRTATWFSRITDGRVRWDAEAVVSPDPLRSFVFEGGNYLPAAINVPEDVQRYVPVGKYDTVAVFFDAGSVPGGWGWGPGLSEGSNHTLWVTVHGGKTPAADWTSWNTEPTEVFIHEPMHGLDGFFDRLGVALPYGYLHGAEDNHYERSPRFGWLPWYRDYLLGTVIDADGTYRGYGPRAFRLGTPREHAPAH
jgi:hypothetical protein